MWDNKDLKDAGSGANYFVTGFFSNPINYGTSPVYGFTSPKGFFW